MYAIGCPHSTQTTSAVASFESAIEDVKDAEDAEEVETSREEAVVSGGADRGGNGGAEELPRD